MSKTPKYLQQPDGGRYYRRETSGSDSLEPNSRGPEAFVSLRAYVESEYLPRVLAGKRSSRPTARFALAPLLVKFGARHMGTLTPREIRNYIAGRLDVVRSATVNKEIRMLKAALNSAVVDKVIAENPLALLRAPRVIASPKPIKFYDRAQLDAIYAAACDHRWIWQFAVNTGMRRGELAKARRSDVTIAGPVAAIAIASEDDSLGDASNINRRTKSTRLRVVPLNDAARSALDYLGEDRLVPMTPGGISKAWEVTRMRAGLSGGVHILRHTFISHLVMNGIPLRTVQVLAGHSSIQMTERYSHLLPGAEAAAVARISL